MSAPCGLIRNWWPLRVHQVPIPLLHLQLQLSPLSVVEHLPMAATVSAVFTDEAIAVSEERTSLSLIGRIFGPAPSTGSLQHFLVDVWNCKGSLTVLPMPAGLVQFIFSDPLDRKKVLAVTPWIISRFMIHVQEWEEPSEEVAQSLLRVPLDVQLWDVPYERLTTLMARCLGSAMGDLKDAAVYVGSETGGAFLHVRVALDVSAPLSQTVSASLVANSKGPFKALVLFERLPLFCFCCGVIGHSGRRCARASEFVGKPLPYGRHTLAKEEGSKVDERTLKRRHPKLSWTRHSWESSVVGNTSATLLTAATKMDQTRSGMQGLAIQAAQHTSVELGGSSLVRKRDSLEEGEILPDPKAVCLNASEMDAGIDETDVRVEATGPARSKSTS
ncbi:unnamed protein product [Linum trigynum]|uniref:DUF4283 domain-containing protein n=1 Tax=Linum trigynum TaxID=586398 RepID=A0AAV2CXV0_9ROSI